MCSCNDSYCETCYPDGPGHTTQPADRHRALLQITINTRVLTKAVCHEFNFKAACLDDPDMADLLRQLAGKIREHKVVPA